MASTFKELYDDFTDTVKIYTERMDVTPVSFMRMLTRGIQIFQRETHYIEAYTDIAISNGIFQIPFDFMMAIEMKDANNYTLLEQEYTQLNRTAEKWQDGYLEVPTDYSMRMPEYLSGSNPDGLFAGANGERVDESVHRMYAIYNQSIVVFPNHNDTALKLWYVPDIQAFSINSPQWSTYDVTTGTYAAGISLRWFPLDTQFLTMFTQSSINMVIAMYEDAFVDYAISRYLRSQSNPNYKEFLVSFWEDINRAKESKPVRNKEMVSEYMFAPYA